MMNGSGRAGEMVIVGIGDERRRDDAVGLMIARELMGRALPDGVRVEIAGEEGFDLLAAIDGTSRAIILAAMRLGDEPGTVHALPPADAEARADYISAPGDVALIDVLELAAMRGGPDVLIVGIEPAEIMPGQTLSRQVQASVGAAAELVRDLATGDREWRFFARGDYG
ncbi:MAG: hydrogenase maturation protease [Armatimonadota bacterium]|jgi:hydrogenase maturation protease